MKTLQISLTLVDDQHARLTAQRDRSLLISEKTITLDTIAALIKKSKTDFYNAEPNPIEVGKQLYFWLDGDARWLSQALDQTGEGLVLMIETVERLAHLPWETLHDRIGFLVMRSNPIVIVRQVAGVAKQRDLPERSLQVMFMATDPEAPGETKLEFEREEADILDATRKLPMVLRVEESGSIAGLKDIWQRYDGTMDVLHLSGHANIREVRQENGETQFVPYFVTETLMGERDEATAEAIAQVLRFREPRLVFLSGCRTGEAGGQGAAPSLAEQLVKQGVPAVLGWGRSVGDRVATVATTVLYEKLATGYTLVQALAFTYQAVSQNQSLDVKQRSQWQLLRLYALGSGDAWGKFVLPSGDQVIAPKEPLEDLFLDAEGRVRVASAAEFVGRRRNLQRCLKALKEQPGVVVHGLVGVGKSTVAKRLLERLIGYTPLVIYQELTEGRLLDALLRQCESDEGKKVLNGNLGLAQKLSKFFKQLSSEKSPPLAIVLDDFEANLEDRGDGLRVMRLAVVEVLQGLLEGMKLSRVPHRIIVTSRYDFGTGMHDQLHREPLAGLRDGDLKKKCDRLTAFQSKEIALELQKKAIELSDGNPRLLQWLDLVLQGQETDQIKILAAMEGKRSELRTQIFAEELLRQQPEALVEMLGRGMVFEIPVPRSVFESVCEAEAQWIERAIAVGLLEVVPDRSVRVPRILMVQGLEVETLAGEAARQLFRVWWEEAENKAEEQALEVHRLALIGGEEAIAVIVADEISATWLLKSRFKEAINLCETTLEEFQHHVILSRLAQAKSFVGKTNEAVSYYQQASELRPSFDSESMPYEQAVIMDGVELLLGFTNIEELYNNQENVLLNLYDTHDKAVQTINLADLSIQIGDIERALDLLQQASKISENVTSPGIESRILNSKGSALRHQGKLEQALSLYHKALEILKVINNDSAKSMILSNIALTLVEQGKCDAATEYFHQASKIFERIGDINGKAILLNNLALSVQAQGNVDYAVSLWMQSVKVLAQVGNYPKLVTFLGNLGVATTQIVYSSQAVWLCLQSQIFQVPLDEAITVLNDLFYMLPDGDPLESLVAATSLFLYNAADNYQQQNELKDLCNRMWGVVAKRNGIRSIPEWQSWTVQHQLDNPQVVIPKLLVQLEMLVGDRWLFDREKI